MPYADSSAKDSICGDSGVVNIPRKARLVFVPADRLASKVSAPPNTLRMRAKAV